MVSFRGQNGLGHAQIGFLKGFNSKFLTSPFHMRVPPPWARKFHFPFVPFEISRNHALIPAADLGKGREGLDFLLFLDLTKAQRAAQRTAPPPLLISRSGSGDGYTAGADLGGGCRGCAPPPTPDLRFSNTTGILQKKQKNYVVYWC